MGMAEHDFVSLSRIEEWCTPGRRLFQSYFAFQNMPPIAAVTDLLKPAVGEVPFAQVQMEYPLRMEVLPQAGLMLVASYHRRWLTEPQVEALLEGISAATELILERPDGLVTEVRDELRKLMP